MALPTESANSKSNTAPSNGVIASRKLAVSENRGRSNDEYQQISTPFLRTNPSNKHVDPTSPLQAHENPHKDQCSLGLNINADDLLCQENQEPSLHQNSKIPKLITCLHRGIWKKSVKVGKRHKRQSQKARVLGPSLSDSLIEKRSSISAKEVDELDIRRFVEFG
ncbi:hypothetical protein SLEP1_g7504 [Rubroshorea leprosula]|uniref:Uncharacterized protein n=1 Tax=Rubroshorea leprosula TaxID=152421 RepID=A0AAV5I9J7_9ROSI|nr:hypothetical protein SLEP1_g7504 [Rubroshorea leprosula]